MQVLVYIMYFSNAVYTLFLDRSRVSFLYFFLSFLPFFLSLSLSLSLKHLPVVPAFLTKFNTHVSLPPFQQTTARPADQSHDPLCSRRRGEFGHEGMHTVLRVQKARPGGWGGMADATFGAPGRTTRNQKLIETINR